jgi:acyl-CoA hydrolase
MDDNVGTRNVRRTEIVAMRDFEAEYRSKLMTKEELIERFKPGDFLRLGVWYGEPHGVMAALVTRGSDISPLYTFNGFTTSDVQLHNRAGIQGVSGFLSPWDRAAHAAHQNMHYIPTHYTFGTLPIRDALRVDYMVYRVAPMDERGMFNFSLTASGEYRYIPWLKENRPETTIVFEVNPNLPRVFGLDEFGNNELSIDCADIIVEDDSELLDFSTEEASEVEQAIARHIASLIEDRSTVQIGFGTIPMAMGHLLADRRGLGIHSEMFCDAHIDLIEAGAVTNAHKGLYQGVSTATFAAGRPRLHEWLRDNRDVAMLPVEEVNNPSVLARINRLVSVNGALTIDSTGQACAHCLGSRTYSGLGGAFEFTFGAQLSPGGMSFLCVPSTSTLKDGRVVSNIVAEFPAGTRITVPEHTVDWVVTEHGAARLKPLTLEQRARALLEIAHPDFREPLAMSMRDGGVDPDRAEVLPDPPADCFLRA